MWAFNHDEATRSFAKAAALDPNCAACYWGVSLTVGPNYNLPFLIDERAKVATEALKLARAHSSQRLARRAGADCGARRALPFGAGRWMSRRSSRCCWPTPRR